MNQKDQRIYEIVYTGNKAYYNVTVDGKRIAEAITEIGQVSVAIFCDYAGISKDQLFVEDTKAPRSERYAKIITDLNSMFIAVKMKRDLMDYKFCGLAISENINESTRSTAI